MLLLFFIPTLFSQEKIQNLDDETRRKFDYYYYAALNAKALNEYGEAFDLFQHCFAIDSTNASLLVELAAFYSVLDNREKSIDLVRKAVGYSPDNYYYNMVFADLAKSMDLNEEVIEVYNNMLKLHPERVDLFFELSNVYSSMGELNKAIEALDSLQKYTGASDAIAINKFRYYNLAGEKQKAFSEIESVVEKNPENIQYILMVGELYLDDLQNDKALAYFERASEIDPESPALILSMVKYYEKTGNKEASIEELQKAITNTKMDVDTKLQLLGRYVALLNQGKQDLNAAQREMDALTALKVASPMIAGAAAEIRLGLGDVNGALAIYREALQRFPQAQSLIYGNAEALYAGKQYEAALRFLDSQLQIMFSDFKLHALQAKTYSALGKRLQQHRALAESYFLQGQLGAAVEQLQFAQQATDGNFYEQSVVDARLRELRKLQEEEAKLRRGG